MKRARGAGSPGLPFGHGPQPGTEAEALGAGAPDWVRQGTQLSETVSTGKCLLPHQDFSHILGGRAPLTCWCQAWPRAGMTADNQAGTGPASAAWWAQSVLTRAAPVPGTALAGAAASDGPCGHESRCP